MLHLTINNWFFIFDTKKGFYTFQAQVGKKQAVLPFHITYQSVFLGVGADQLDTLDAITTVDMKSERNKIINELPTTSNLDQEAESDAKPESVQKTTNIELKRLTVNPISYELNVC